MRRGWVPGAMLVVLGLGVWLAFRDTPGATPGGASASTRASSFRFSTAPSSLFQAASPAAMAARLPIRGTVRGPNGPVPGAVVLASAPVVGESLSALSCRERAAGQDTPDCGWRLGGEQLLTLVAQRQGEVPVLARAVTREDGAFTLEGLEAGSYSLWVESAGGTGLRHGVAAGEEGVELRLVAGVRLSGRVVDELKAPVPGALVTAVFKAHSRFFETVTDEGGRYRLGPMPPGDYALVIAKEGLLASEEWFLGYEGEEERDPITLSRPRRIAGRVLRAGEPVAGVRVRAVDEWNEPIPETLTDGMGRFSFEGMRPVSQKLIAEHGGDGAFLRVYGNAASALASKRDDYSDVTLDLAPAIYVQGVVLDEERRPIPGASVEVQQEREDEFTAMSERTDAQGRYRFPGPVRPGSMSFDVRAVGHLSLRELTRSVEPGQGTVDFTLKRAVLVEGIVVDAAGQPIEGAPLRLCTLEGNAAVPVGGNTRTGPDGRFSLDAPTAGTYRLEAGGRKMVKQVLEVAAPSSQRILAERLLPVTGQVVDEAGGPLPYVRVSLWPDASDTRGRVLTESRTDRQGRFSLEAPAEGRYRIAAELEHRDILHATSQGLDVGRGGAQVRLRFEVGRRLSGVVVDRSGQPIPDAHLTVLPALHTPACSAPSLGVFTDANGRFTFQGISGEQLTLHVWKDGYLDASRDGVSRGFPLEPGDRDVRLVLPRLAGVRGRFVRADGSPIMLFHLNGEAHEDEEGRFFLPIHSTGTMTLELAEPGSPYAPVRRTLAVQQEVGVEMGTITPVP